MEARTFLIIETKEKITVYRVLGNQPLKPSEPMTTHPIFEQSKPIGDIFEVVYKMVTGELPL